MLWSVAKRRLEGGYRKRGVVGSTSSLRRLSPTLFGECQAVTKTTVTTVGMMMRTSARLKSVELEVLGRALDQKVCEPLKRLDREEIRVELNCL